MRRDGHHVARSPAARPAVGGRGRDGRIARSATAGASPSLSTVTRATLPRPSGSYQDQHTVMSHPGARRPDHADLRGITRLLAVLRADVSGHRSVAGSSGARGRRVRCRPWSASPWAAAAGAGSPRRSLASDGLLGNRQRRDAVLLQLRRRQPSLLAGFHRRLVGLERGDRRQSRFDDPAQHVILLLLNGLRPAQDFLWVYRCGGHLRIVNNDCVHAPPTPRLAHPGRVR